MKNKTLPVIIGVVVIAALVYFMGGGDKTAKKGGDSAQPIIIFLEKSAFAFCFKFKIDRSGLPLVSKTIISQTCLPSSFMISILSSGETSIKERPPPFTK